jgi:AcrR family transcriptional regulator
VNIVLAYLIYLLISVGLTVIVGRALSRSGRGFLLEVFDGNAGLAEAVNRLLVVGFYLLNLGFVTLTMQTSGNIDGARQGLQLLSVKIGEVLLVLGALHFANLAIFAKVRSRAQASSLLARGVRRTLTSVADPALTPRAQQTRSAIIEAALELFRSRGYEATTMRAIAERAGVSTGNAYYYFASKEELIQEFYARSHAEHLTASRAVLDHERDFTDRLRGTLRALIDVQAPYHAFAATFYKHAAEPSSPLSPFSNRSSPTREAAIALYREVIEGSNVRVSGDLADRLPELLWLASMGVILYWVHDTSEGCAKTYRLIDAAAPVIGRLVAASRIPVLRGALRDVTAIIDDLRS